MRKLSYKLIIDAVDELPLSSWFTTNTELKNISSILHDSDSASIEFVNKITGFFTFTHTDSTVFFKLFIKDETVNEILLTELLKEFCRENYTSEQAVYFAISFYKDSAVPEFKNYADRVFKMEYTPDCSVDYQSEIPEKAIDTDELIDFHYTCYNEDAPYMSGNWEKMITNYSKNKLPTYSFSVRSDNKLTGTCIGMLIPHRDFKYLFSICVHPNFRNTGIGKKLLESFLHHKPVKKTILSVYESAESACKLYKSVGFNCKSVTSYVYNV